MEPLVCPLGRLHIAALRPLVEAWSDDCAVAGCDEIVNAIVKTGSTWQAMCEAHARSALAEREQT